MRQVVRSEPSGEEAISLARKGLRVQDAEPSGLAEVVPIRRAIPRLALSVEETAEALGVGRSVIYDLLRRGELRGKMIGARRVIPVRAIEDFLSAD